MKLHRCWPVLVLALSACATAPPARLSGGPFAEITPRMAQTQDVLGSLVRWGGTIATTSPAGSETCFQVVSHPLDSSARPEEGDLTEGRFIACAPGFYEPAVYASGREITVVGKLEIPYLGKVGKYEYRFPRVAAREGYLWPKRVPPIYPPPYYYDPFWFQPGPWMMGPW